MANVFDIIIVGAGPAGSSCAYHAARGGAKVALLEKKRIPREKFCAGGIPGTIFTEYSLSVKRMAAEPIRGYLMTCKGEKPVTGSITEDQLYSVVRSRFDFQLVHLGMKNGVEFQECCNVKRVEHQGKYFRITARDGATYIARYLVGADGGHSTIAQLCSFYTRIQDRSTGTSGYYEIHPPDSIMENYRRKVHLDFNTFPGGFTGILPKGDHLWIGAYTASKRHLSELEKHVSNFMNRFGLVGKGDHFKGLYIPLYNPNLYLARSNVLLVGEAACLVNPLSGEGVKPALDSGRIAAEELLKALKEETDPLSYSDRIHKEIGRDFLIARRLSQLAHQFPDIAYEGMTRVAPEAVKILNGSMSYEDFRRRLKTKIMKKLGLTQGKLTGEEDGS